MSELEEYCIGLPEAVSSQTQVLIVHTLLLLAFSRIGLPDLPSARLKPEGKTADKSKLLRDFAGCAPEMAQLLLDEDEKKAIRQLSNNPSAVSIEDESNTRMASPADLWADLKDTHQIKSEAMEDLLKMTGLRRVKQTAFELFKQGLVVSRVDAEIRNLNAPSLNYVCFR